MFDVVTNPDGFLGSRAHTNDLRLPLLIVTATAIAGGGSVLVLLAGLSESLTGPGAGFLIAGLVIGFLSAVLGTITVWPVSTIAIHVTARWLGGTGEFRSLLSLTGWGYLPQLLAGACATGALTISLTGTPFPTDPAAVPSFVTTVRGRPVVRVVSVLAVPATVWSGLYWWHAVRHVHGLPHRRAMASVVLPVGVSLGWLLFHV